MAPIFSKYLTKHNAFICGGIAVSLWILASRKHINKVSRFNNGDKNKNHIGDIRYQKTGNSERNNNKVNLNLAFLRQLLSILKIVIPGWKSIEALYLVFIVAILMGKTCCDLLVLKCISRIESSLIIMDRRLFIKRMLTFLLYTPLFAITTNLLKLTLGDLKIRLRKNLSFHVFNEYFEKLTYYRVSNLDNRISNADQVLVSDVDKLCDSFVDVYSNITKPLLDIVLFSYQVSTNVGSLTPRMILIYFLVSGVILTSLRKPIAQLTVKEQKLEGEFRHANSRIITHSEEIAFYQGNVKEKLTLMNSFNNLISHLRKSLKFRVLVGVIDNIVAKYIALCLGWYTYSMPFLSGSFGLGAMSIGERSRLYYLYGFMILKLAQAVGRLVLAGNELTRLAGLTIRVTQLQHVLKDLNKGTYKRTTIGQESNHLQPSGGKLIFKNNLIKFDKVPVITPSGDILIKQLSLEIHSGMNVLVCGPNGAGKSSIFRILGELWPLFGGELTKPPSGKLFYVPQKPYMVLGSLRDQITYPHTGAQAKRRGYSEEQLEQYLKLVHLDYLVEREGGLDALADWSDILSGGEKQRIAMARLFYHSPQFAILDECTSAVSVDIENLMYNYCRDVGITLLTVSHRKSLWKHHEYFLYLDGRGSYNFSPIQEDMEQFGS